MAQRILIVDDDETTREVLRDKLAHEGYEVEATGSAEKALGRVRDFDPALVLTDLRMPGLSGLDLLAKVRESMPAVSVVVMTGHEDMRSAVEAMKAGAFDYVVKPMDLDALDELVARCFRERELAEEADRREKPLVQARDPVVGTDPRMIEIYKLIGVLSRNRATVLVRGETGTGKEMIARAIHSNSLHADAPFIAVNCTALTDTLLESELFGHVKGAFTGATSSRKGYFELAGSGTIFLDEIGDTSAEFQSKLLRVLQDRSFFPVGGEEQRTTEARVIAATHQPLEELVEEGSFREDLYFRLRVVEVHLPPLRDRKGDIPLLAEHLLARTRDETGHDVEHIAEEAMEILVDHDWPGNVRELENVLTRGAILARGPTLGPDHLAVEEPDLVRAVEREDRERRRSEDGKPATLAEVIAEHVQQVLEHTGGNKSEAARILEISRSRLSRMVDRHDLDVP